MDIRNSLGLAALFLAGISFLIFLYFFLSTRSRTVRSLMGSAPTGGDPNSVANIRSRLQDDAGGGAEMARLKKNTKRRLKKIPKPTLEELFFQAGMYSDKDKRDFRRLQLLAPIGSVIFFMSIIFTLGMGADMVIIGFVLGILFGAQIPKSIVDRRIRARHEDILFYLPLVIEQIAIGVSSGLDIGPCIQKVVSMADERDTHNVVTELFRHAQFFVKSGLSLDHALTEIGKASGSQELKHSFSALAQVARHGGEISRQLQELADAVSQQRETKIEGRIKRLELDATGPVALVFCGFLVILIIGFGIQLKDAF